MSVKNGPDLIHFSLPVDWSTRFSSMTFSNLGLTLHASYLVGCVWGLPSSKDYE